jgi:Raf kinase inhibitor-like YbhB/YbcL family protein
VRVPGTHYGEQVRRGDHDKRGRGAAPRSACLLLSILLFAFAGLLSGCGLISGPQPLSEDAPLDMEVSSPVFTQSVIPARFTCHGAGVSPPIFWSGTPPHTKSLALVVDDSATPVTPRVYWIVFNISPATTDIQAGQIPPGARQAQNSTGRVGYDPPCPIGAPHKYRFSVYALNAVLGSLPNGAHLLQAWTTIARHVIGRGTMPATACAGPYPQAPEGPGHVACRAPRSASGA